MDNFFIDITKKLNLKPYKNTNLTDVSVITLNFSNHTSIRKLQEFLPNIKHDDLNFSPVSLEDVTKEILNLNAQNNQ